MANQVALTRKNVMFLGLPRYAKDKSTPSLVRQDEDGNGSKKYGQCCLFHH